MAIHFRCLNLNFSKLNHFRALAASKQTDSSKSDYRNKTYSEHSLIVRFHKQTALTKHCTKSSALTKPSQTEKRLCPKHETSNSVYPITNSVTSLIPLPLDNIISLIGCQSCNHGHRLSDIENLIGSKDIAKPVGLSSDDIIIIQDSGSRSRFLNDLKVINEILSKEKCKSNLRRDPCVDWTDPSGALKNDSKNKDDNTLILCSDLQGREDDNKPEPADDPKQKLLLTKDFLEEQIPMYMKSSKGMIKWQIYTPDVVFENNFWGKNKVYNGLGKYAMQVLKYRILSQLKFTVMHVEILRITAHPEDQTVRVRWRLIGHGFFKSIGLPFKKMAGKKIEQEGQWYDGFSIFYVQDDGRVYKHRLDRVMPDEELQKSKMPTLATKLAILLGVIPKPSLNDFQSLFFEGLPSDKSLNS